MSRRLGAFTLIELLIVVGLISVIMSLLLPVIGKARAAARSTACLSNVRQLGMAWQLYTAENKGRLIEYIWNTPKTPDVAWGGYWLGMADQYQVRGDVLLCPSASDPSKQKPGYGSNGLAWNGEMGSNGSPIRLNANSVRLGSYGFNRYLTTEDPQVTKITSIKGLTEVPVFFDCAWVDAQPIEQDPSFPVDPPPDLNGNVTASSPEHWRFLLARHGRGINVFFADGSARWTALEETYLMKWNSYWQGYRLSLPR
jgi:prepilin-type processing-associated H-X9-DG protein